MTHGWSIKIKYITGNGWIKCIINHEMVAKMIFLNKNLQEEKRKQIKLCGTLLQIEAFLK